MLNSSQRKNVDSRKNSFSINLPRNGDTGGVKKRVKNSFPKSSFLKWSLEEV
jgi:hypothetical protein